MISVGLFQRSIVETFPTQAASRAWVLGMPSRDRLNLVRPPVESVTGSLVCLSALASAQRVALTAAASLMRPLGLGHDLGKSFRLVAQKLLDRACGLFVVALPAGQG